MEIKEGYTRVSKIIGQWNQFAHINKTVLENKCIIGTNVHEKISSECEGIFIELKPHEQPYYESWKKWWDSTEIDLKRSVFEKRFYCDDLKITGCVDTLIYHKEKKILVDYKTSASPHKKSWALQATFYHYLVKKSGIDIDNEVWFLQLKKDGKIGRLYTFEITIELWEVCQSALNTYRYFNG